MYKIILCYKYVLLCLYFFTFMYICLFRYHIYTIYYLQVRDFNPPRLIPQKGILTLRHCGIWCVFVLCIVANVSKKCSVSILKILQFWKWIYYVSGIHLPEYRASNCQRRISLGPENYYIWQISFLYDIFLIASSLERWKFRISMRRFLITVYIL